MRKIFFLSIPFIILMIYTLQHPFKNSSRTVQVTSNTLIDPEGKTICDRILTPEGYERISVEENSFARYLRDLPLKPHGADVYLYNGQVKTNRVYVAVVDMEIGDRDLQQCADAVIRLRAEYLFARKLYGLIHFNFTNGFRADYAKWANGYRIEVKDNQAQWIRTASMDYNYNVFRQYLNAVFTYAGTYSLSQEMIKAAFQDIQPGDVLIRGGSPGHAVIVIDVAVNRSTGRKIFLLAQSYMPAQDIHVLKNPANNGLNPWYEVDPSTEQISTPEWDFSIDELKRFQ